MYPVYCTRCRVHIPVAVSNIGQGMCPYCIQTSGPQQTVSYPGVFPMAWSDVLFGSLAIIDALKQVAFQPLQLFAGALGVTAGSRDAPGANPMDKIAAVMFLTQVALAFFVCGAIGMIAGRRWGYLTSAIVSAVFFLGIILTLAQSSDQTSRIANILSLFLYGGICTFAIVRFASARSH